VSDFSQHFVPHDVVNPRFAFLGGVNLDFDDETSVLECFQKFIDEDMWQLFAKQTNTWCGYKITRFIFFPLPYKLGNSERCVLRDHSIRYRVSCVQQNTLHKRHQQHS
jgi:hypothetical protein